MLSYMEYLGVPVTITIGFVAVFLVIQIIGELLEFKGKVVPEFFKIRKYFARKRDEREKIDQMFDAIKELKETSKENTEHIQKLEKEMLSMRIDSMRNEIIKFAADVQDINVPVTRERFNRIFKTYNEYEDLIEKTGRTNGEVDIAYRIIDESYEERTRNHTFIEDVRGW